MRRSIRVQLIVAVALVAVALFALLSYLLIKAQHRSLIAQMARQADQFSETIKSSTRYAMLRNRGEDVHRIIDTIGEQEGIHRVRIFNKEGKIIYSPDKAEIGRMVDKQAEACFGCHAVDAPLERLDSVDRSRILAGAADQRLLSIINPIYNEPNCSEAACHAHPESQTVLGVLDMTLSLAEVDEQMAASRNKAILFTAVTIFSTSALILLLFHRLVGRPARALLAATRRVASGDLDHRISVERNDELGELERSFNEMTAQLAQTQTQLYQSDKLASVGRMAAGVAHEINNPLTGILSFSSLLQKNRSDDPELQADLEIIVRETKRCREIVKGLLDFSRQVAPRKAAVDLNDIVGSALAIVDHQLQLGNIRVTTTLASQLPPVLVDPHQIEQVLINLLVNAADAVGPSGGEIFVGTMVKEGDGGRQVEIKVADDGCGIAEEDLSKIFDPFFTTKEEKKGTGLGLAVAWGIVNEHEGSISASSKPDRGATFTVLLPVDRETAARPEGDGDARAA